ncbi:MAG TPA: NPCBM/NEW2 domain-containing protein [Lacipirellulaceae bacterium]
MAAENVTPAAMVVPVEGEPFIARLVSADGAGQVVFQTEGEGGAPTASTVPKLATDDLVRWGNPVAVASQPMVLLADGSRIVAAADWSGGAAVRIDGDAVVVRTDDWGDVRLPRSSVRGLVFAQRSSLTDRQRLEYLVRSADAGQDQVLLANQDRLTGAIKELPGGSITVVTAAGDAKLPISRVEAAILAREKKPGVSPETQLQPPQASIDVGMRDGSLLYANRVLADEHHTALELAGGARLIGGSAGAIASLQSLGGRFTYLSDLDPADYRHVPYLDIKWPYMRDRNVSGNPLMVGGKQYPKGLGMHSAARLTYKLERQFKRFAADIAIDDSAGKRGSVTFGVYVLRDGKWQPAYTSEVVRGGDAPQSVSVDLAGADAMTLVVDYADRGDELDHADWLDARLIKN